MSERTATTLSVNVGSRLDATYMGDNTVIDLSINTHLKGEFGGGIISSISQHLTLDEAKRLVAQLNYAITEIELEVVQNA